MSNFANPTISRLNPTPELEKKVESFNIYARVMRYVFAGAATSTVAATVMAIFMMFDFVLFQNQNGLFFFQVIGSVIYGTAGLAGTHWAAAFVGMFLHFGVLSLVWGVFFGILSARLKVSHYGTCLAMGLALGVVSMILDSYIVAPPVLRSLYGVDIWNQNMPKTADWVAHLLFGASFVIFPKILTFMLDEKYLSKRRVYP